LDVERDVGSMATEQLEAETCTLAAQLAAATCRFLLLVGELERREAWRSWGCRSLAHWLSWQCGLGLVAAREHVRVASALGQLPLVVRTFARGELSYSKVRALTRLGSLEPAAEAELVEFAKIATAAQLERTVSGYRSVVRNTNPGARSEREPAGVRTTTHDDGTVSVTFAHVDADVAAMLVAAVDDAPRRLRHGNDSAESSRGAAIESTVRRLAQPDGDLPPGTTLVVHTDVDLTVGVDEATGITMTVEAVRRLGCDTAVRRVRGDTDADLGRARRTVSRRLRRALLRRDGQRCRFPGCEHTRWLHAHHIWHWTDGGPTDLANLVALCSYHHTLVHEGGWSIDGDPHGHIAFVSPDGRRIDEDHRPRVRPSSWRIVRNRHRAADPLALRGQGEPLDLHLTVAVLCSLIPPDRN
jgi:hypothetical protein